MLNFFRITIVFMMVLFSLPALSNSLLNQHALATSQAISAFYMYNLTEGDEKYKAEYYLAMASAQLHYLALKSENKQIADELKPLWNKIHEANNFESTIARGYNVSSYIRLELRKYIDLLYLNIAGANTTQTRGGETNLSEQLLRISLDVEMLSVRFFDVANASKGAFSISGGDMAIDPISMAKNIRSRLQIVQNRVQDELVKKSLKTASGKWRYIEGYVINYNQGSAYMLVYYNKNRIKNLIGESRHQLSTH